jgi:hypothetical protein
MACITQTIFDIYVDNKFLTMNFNLGGGGGGSPGAGCFGTFTVAEQEHSITEATNIASIGLSNCLLIHFISNNLYYSWFIKSCHK